MDPQNMHTIVMIGHCHLDLHDFDAALKYYFKVEYNDPDNIRILKPIAWCYFVQGKYEQSKKYFDKITSSGR
jgi:tetratricopeptide (TPR) repeat protein